MEEKKIKKCVGPIILDEQDRILLITNKKWKNEEGEDIYVVPGGEIEGNETEEEALRREIREELGIEIEILYRVPGEKTKPIGKDFRPEDRIQMVFIDFFTKALSKEIKPNPDEVEKFIWDHTAEELLVLQENGELKMGNTMKGFLESYIHWKKENKEKDQEISHRELRK